VVALKATYYKNYLATVPGSNATDNALCRAIALARGPIHLDRSMPFCYTEIVVSGIWSGRLDWDREEDERPWKRATNGI
jgi:hypothetical protein